MSHQNFEEGEVDRMIGGGLFSYITNAEIHHNQFTNNGDPSVENGGAVYAQTSTIDWSFDNRSSGRPRCEINEINIHDNFYRDNDAIYGNTFSNRTFTEEINLVTEAAPKANRLDLLRLILHVISNQYLIKIFKNNLNHPGD